jgi:hypothetical protein
MLSYIEKRTITNDPGKIFQNYFIPFLCLLKCASFSGNTRWASSYGASAQCEFIIKNLVKVPIESFNDFLIRFGFTWDVESERFFIKQFYKNNEITLEDLDMFDESEENVAVSALLNPIHKNNDILFTEYISHRATLILSAISKRINEKADIFGNRTLDDILLEYVDEIPKKQDERF